MEKCNYGGHFDKFTQHEQFKKYHIDSRDKILAEANVNDDYFAVGFPLTHPDVLDLTKWADNSTHLERILMILLNIV